MPTSRRLLDTFGVKDQRPSNRPVTRTNPVLRTTKAEQTKALAGFGLTPDGEQLPYVPAKPRKTPKKKPRPRVCPNCQWGPMRFGAAGGKGSGRWDRVQECPGCRHLITEKLTDLTDLYRRVMTLGDQGLRLRAIVEATGLSDHAVYGVLHGSHVSCRYYASLEDLPD